MNSIYFGDGYEGIGSASWGYFGKAPSALDADECTLLAGIPNAPSVYALSQNPGPVSYTHLSLDTFSIVFFLIGGAVVGGLQLLRSRLEEPAEG